MELIGPIEPHESPIDPHESRESLFRSLAPLASFRAPFAAFLCPCDPLSTFEAVLAVVKFRKYKQLTSCLSSSFCYYSVNKLKE